MTPAVAAERRPIALHRMRVVPGGRPPEVQEYPPQVATEVLLAGRVRGKRRTGPLRHLPGGWSDVDAPGERRADRSPRRSLPLRRRPRADQLAGRPSVAPLAPSRALRAGRAGRAHGRARAARRDPRRHPLGRPLAPPRRPRRRAGGTRRRRRSSSRGWSGQRAQGLRGRVRGYVPDLWPDGSRSRSRRAEAAGARPLSRLATTSPGTERCSSCRRPSTRRDTSRSSCGSTGARCCAAETSRRHSRSWRPSGRTSPTGALARRSTTSGRTALRTRQPDRDVAPADRGGEGLLRDEVALDPREERGPRVAEQRLLRGDEDGVA